MSESTATSLINNFILTHTQHYFSDLFTYEVLFSMKILLHPKEWKYIPTKKKLVLNVHSIFAIWMNYWCPPGWLSHLWGPGFQPLDPLFPACYGPDAHVHLWYFLIFFPPMWPASNQKGFGLWGCAGLSWTFLSHPTSHCVFQTCFWSQLLVSCLFLDHSLKLTSWI